VIKSVKTMLDPMPVPVILVSYSMLMAIVVMVSNLNHSYLGNVWYL
jgi:hypothetical protein